MIDTLKENQVTQPITYPVRAGLAANDIDAIKTLLKNTTFTNATLTIWSSEGDSVDAAKLSKLIKDVGLGRVYVDVPEDLKSKLELSAASTMSSAMINLGASMTLLVLLRMLWSRDVDVECRLVTRFVKKRGSNLLPYESHDEESTSERQNPITTANVANVIWLSSRSFHRIFDPSRLYFLRRTSENTRFVATISTIYPKNLPRAKLSI